MSFRKTNNIKTLSEQLGSLQITNKTSDETIEQLDEAMSVAPVSVTTNNNKQAVILKSMVPDPEWFDGNRTKFEDWQKEIQLFLKNNRIMVILAHLRGGIAGIYAQKKLDELDKELGIQDQNNFVKEIKTTFSNKIKVADAEWKIKTFKQEKQNTADFMIEFKALAMKVDTDKLHVIFLLKKNVQSDIIRTILGYLSIAVPETLKEQKVAITLVGQGYKSTEG